MFKCRPEKDADRKAIFEINRLAFGQETESCLVDMIRESENYVNGLSLVAEKEGEVVGHILFTKISLEPPNGDFVGLALAPMAVRPDLQRQGIGSSLIIEGLKACKSRGYKTIIVIGHPNYYPRFGFSSAREKGLESPFPVPDEAFMVLELVPGCLDGVEGIITFAPEFTEVE